MPPYLTPARFKTMAFGMDVSELDDGELAALCGQATAWVDAFCLVPRLPQRHDFRGGVITGEQHPWRYPETPFDIGQRRAYPLHWPVTKMNQFRIYVTNTQYVGIQPTELFINNTNRYVEVVSLALTSAGLFNALIIPNIGLATPTVTLNYEYGWSFEEPDETLVPADGQTYRAQNQWWFSDADRLPVIRVDGADQSAGYTVDYNEGTVTFDTDLDAGSVVSAHYHYKLPWEIQYATGQIVAWLHAEAEQHARGMAHLNTLKIGEFEMGRPRVFAPSDRTPPDLETLIPEAATLLYTYRFDHATIR